MTRPERPRPSRQPVECDHFQSSLIYDPTGRLQSVTPQGKTQPTLSESFAYQGSQLTQEVVISGTTTYINTFIFRPSGDVFMLVQQQASQGQTIASHYWYVTDGQGTVVRDEHITIVNTYQYDAWGNLPL